MNNIQDQINTLKLVITNLEQELNNSNTSENWYTEQHVNDIPYNNEEVDKNTCTECNKQLDPIKGAKAIEFSNKKFWRTICYFCQKKMQD